MNKDTMATWPKDFTTDLPMVPAGEFTDFSQYPKSTQPAEVRKLPVLRGFFDAHRFDMDPKLPIHLGWGMVPLNRAVALTYRIQRGSNVLYWLANPSDPHVWEAIDKWAASNTMVLAAEFQDGQGFIVRRDFNLSHPMFAAARDYIDDASHTLNFAADVSSLFLRDEVKKLASTDLPAYPQLRHVQACMVRTPDTKGIAVAVHEGKPGPDGAVADAVSALMESMLKPKKRRH